MIMGDELIDYVQKANKLESYEDIPAVIEVEIGNNNVISTSSYYGDNNVISTSLGG